MVVKGIVSAIDIEAMTVDVILPEYNKVVVRPDSQYTRDVLERLKVNDFVLVVVFNNDFTDTFLLLPGIQM